jgi:hypothetical protein
MTRRTFAGASSALAAGSAAAQAAPRNAIMELRYIRMRNGPQVQRTTDFLSKYALPAMQRAGIQRAGFFNALIGENAPFVLSVTSYPSLNDFGRLQGRVLADKDFQKGWDEYNSMSELSFIRVENSLLYGFDTMPDIEAPPVEEKRAPRIFELRTYQSNNFKAGLRKIKMFDDGEIAIFRRLDMRPVFFGQTIVGNDLPNLTYMLAFDDLAHRERAWRAFGGDPEWQKLRAMPGLSDAEIVSNISSAILRPMPFSPIR